MSNIYVGTRISTLYEQYFPINFTNIYTYFKSLNTSYHLVFVLFGFMLFLTIANQLISGVMLSFSLVPEPMIIPLVREEEDLEDLYIDDFFWLHERGVDLVFIFIFLHLFRKLYMNVPDAEQDISWKSGVFSFLIILLVVFLGLVLCCTHLSEITLVIAVNAFKTFFLFIGKAYTWLFTDCSLSSDTIIRLTYLHYVSAFLLSALGLCHGIDMHYDWKSDSTIDGVKQEVSWFDEVLLNELGKTFDILVLTGISCLYLYTDPEAIHYEIFMWGDVGMVVDVRFYGVAPHWYFRPYMAWLIACPYHYLGIFGLVFFFVVIFFQLNIFGLGELDNYKILKNTSITTRIIKQKSVYTIQLEKINVWHDFQWKASFAIFLVAIAHTLTYLPYGRFYNRLGGNFSFLLTYIYIYSYLGYTFLKNTWIFRTVKLVLIN